MVKYWNRCLKKCCHQYICWCLVLTSIYLYLSQLDIFFWFFIKVHIFNLILADCVCVCVCVCVCGGRGAGGGGRRDEKIKICLRKLGVNKVHSGRMFYLYFDLISFSSLAFHYFLQDDLLI